MLRCLSSSAAAAEGGRHKGDPGLEEKSIQAIYSRSQLYSQRALCLPEPLMKLQDVGPWGGLPSSASKLLHDRWRHHETTTEFDVSPYEWWHCMECNRDFASSTKFRDHLEKDHHLPRVKCREGPPPGEPGTKKGKYKKHEKREYCGWHEGSAEKDSERAIRE